MSGTEAPYNQAQSTWSMSGIPALLVVPDCAREFSELVAEVQSHRRAIADGFCVVLRYEQFSAWFENLLRLSHRHRPHHHC